MSESTGVPLVTDLERSLFHQFVDLTSTSHVISTKKGFLAIISLIAQSLPKKMSNLSYV